MGIHCDINLRKPNNGKFLPGSIISGVVRYTLDEDIVFTKITVSLKGKGNLVVQNMRKTDQADGSTKDEEIYVSEDIVVLNEERGHVLPIGSYDTRFFFQLPLNIPPTLDLVKSAGINAVRCSINIPPTLDSVKGACINTVRCRINYYLRIRFHSPEGNKQFTTAINVSPGVNPRLSMEPRIYDKQRKLVQLLRDSFVTLKVTINNPIVSPGGKAELVYEIFNDTNVHFKGVDSKLVEVLCLPRRHCGLTFLNEVADIIKIAGVRSGDSQIFHVEIPIPKDVNSIENSQLIARDYFVKITVYLPLPYRNVSLKVPLQIGDIIEERIMDGSEVGTSTWEVVDEDELINTGEDL